MGGSEQVLTLLDRAMTSAGHRSIVIAAEGSKVAGTLIPSPKVKGRLDDSIREWGRRAHRQLILDALRKYRVDLVHMHSLDFYHYLPPGDVAVLATLHLPPDWYPASIFEMRRPLFHMNCVSWSQYRNCPHSFNMLEPISNGVDVDRLQQVVPKKKFALALGRICPEKGYHFALDAAKKAGVELLLAGEIFPYDSHLEYFRKEIAPRLDKSRRYLGPIGFSKKRRILSQAKCLTITSTVAETSSLVAMESLACGTPVIAFKTGALPEIIADGQTGFLVSSVDEMSDALGRIDQIDPDVCRQAARSFYSATRMGTRYLDLYRELVADQRSRKVPASAGFVTNRWLPCASSDVG